MQPNSMQPGSKQPKSPQPTAVVAATPTDCVASIRTVIGLAGRDNSRMVAAAIGSNLQVITGSARTHLEIARADAVRDASLKLLMSLVTTGDADPDRRAALTLLDRLEASLAA